MKNTLKLAVAAFLSSVMLWSCSTNSDQGEIKYQMDYTSSQLIMGTRTSTGDYQFAPIPPSVTMLEILDLSTMQGSMDFSFNGLVTLMGNLTFSTGPIVYTRNPELGSFSANVPSMTAGGVPIYDFRYYSYHIWWYVSFTINDQDFIICPLALIKNQAAGGTPASILPLDGITLITGVASDPDGFTNKTIGYGLELSPSTGSANIHMYNVQFSNNMPAQEELIIPGVKFKLSQSGLVFTSDEPIIPTAAGVPYNQFEINNFMCTLPYTGMNGNLSFNCSAANWLVRVSELGIIDLTANN